MGTNVDHFLNAQHCLAVAAAFIAIIAACATLINSAHNKAESLASRIRDATKEFRERSGDRFRCAQIREQIELFHDRYRKVQRAQRLLFFTIGVFIASLAIFIGLGLYVMYFNIADESVHTIAHTPVKVIGAFVTSGTVCMLLAIYLQYWELGKSYKTLCIEMRDCRTLDGTDSSRITNTQPLQVVEGAAEMTSGLG